LPHEKLVVECTQMEWFCKNHNVGIGIIRLPPCKKKAGGFYFI
jgi:hypothetical protein